MRTARIVTVFLFGMMPVANINGQQLATLPRGVTLGTMGTTPANSERAGFDPSQSRTASTARGALIGVGAGAATGVIAAFIITHDPKVFDHSEDGLAYLVLSLFGAAVGLVVGAVSGFLTN